MPAKRSKATKAAKNVLTALADPSAELERSIIKMLLYCAVATWPQDERADLVRQLQEIDS